MRLNHDSGQRIPENRYLLLLAMLLLFRADYVHSQTSAPNSAAIYVGSLACKKCHPEEYADFMAYAKKSTSFNSIEKRIRHLTPEEIKKCYPCHTTGYGKPGGFVSLEKTPNLKNAGCEVCHGPGSRHVKTMKPEDIIGKLSKKDCTRCHTSERVKAFKYKPLLHGGAH